MNTKNYQYNVLLTVLLIVFPGTCSLALLNTINLNSLLAHPLLKVLNVNLFSEPNTDKVEPELLDLMSSNGGTAEMIMHFNGVQDVFQNIRDRDSNSEFASIADRHRAVVQALKIRSNNEHSLMEDILTRGNYPFQKCWATNMIFVESGDVFLLQLLSILPSVTRVTSNPTFSLSPIVSDFQSLENEINAMNQIQWGVQKIEAPACWEQGVTGNGITVCTIDSGVRFTHDALFANWRDNHGWFDPYEATSVPNDQNGHGTHTMGTICGSNGIGVAPGATWVACKGCSSSTCGGMQLMTCGQWCAAPTRWNGTDEDLSMKPDVVSNSWGSAVGNQDFYDSILELWEICGIQHCFALGNSGPTCVSAGSPGDRMQTFSVGATTIDNGLASYSSRGPAVFMSPNFDGISLLTKPDICAPGSLIYSASHTGDNEYKTLSGTSMATPHVAGTMALVLAANQLFSRSSKAAELEYPQMISILTSSAIQKQLQQGTVPLCDVNLLGDSFPSNRYGNGLVNSSAAVLAIRTISLNG